LVAPKAPVFAAFFAILTIPQIAGAACRQALALGLDVSGSVDEQEYRLQLQGLANALRDPAVENALLARPDAPVEMAVYVWSGQDHKIIVLDWVALDSAQAIETAATHLAGTRRATGDPTTAIGSAVAFGNALLTMKSGCAAHTLDISGDGENNTGPRPRDLHQILDQSDITLNALVILDPDTPETGLVDYFRAEVIHGPGAFVETASGYTGYKDAMIRKLLRELQGMVFSQLEQRPEPDRKNPYRISTN
jgi:hypothetical protein